MPQPAPAAPPKTATSQTPAPTPPIPAADANGQLIVSMAIVTILGALGIGLVISAVITKDWTQAGVGLGTIIGVLGNALTAPTGIANVLRATTQAQAPTDASKP